MSLSAQKAAEVLVLGAGVSGLAAARELEARGKPVTVLESCPTPGGLTRTADVDDFSFDCSGHFMHLIHHESPAAIPHANLRDEDWLRVERRSRCFVAGQMVDAPIQYNLGQLPSVLLERCKASYEKRPAGANPNPSFRDYVVSGFGQELADLFLIPQNQKTMSADLSKLSQAGVRRFFPPPDDQKVRQGMEKMPRAAGAEYNSRFWYPKEGGIQRLVDGLAGGLKDLRVRQTVVKLDLEKRRLHTRDGQCYGWGKAISSIPLRDLCLMTGDRELEEAARPLSSGATVIFNVGVRGNVPEQLKGVHWVYVPEATLPFYRVGVYSNISPGTCAVNNHAMYIEVGYPSLEVDRQDAARELLPQVLAGLEKLGWVDTAAIRCMCIQIIPCAYVHLTAHRDQAVQQICRRLEHFGLFPIGRYGLWDYTGMEDAIVTAIQCAKEKCL